MTDSYGPFDSAPWADQTQWYRHAPKWASSGVNGSPASSTTTGDLPLTLSGLNFTVGTGRAWVRGAGFERTGSPASQVIAANTNASLSRRDRVVLRRDLAAKTVAPVLILGTPSSSPSAPNIQQNETGQWDERLFSFLVPPNSGTGITGIVDERRFIDAGPKLLWSNENVGPSGGIAIGATATGAINAVGPLPEHDPGPIRVLVTGQLSLSSSTPVAGFLQVGLGSSSSSPNLGNIGIRHRFHNGGVAPILSYTVDASAYSDGAPKYLWLLAWSDVASGAAFTVNTSSWQAWQL